jgi:hypothetical protein
MAKAFLKAFENFKGLSYRTSNLTRPPNYAVDAKNIRVKKPYNICGETGFRLAAQPKPMYGIHTYTYQDATGVVKEELLGVNETLWRLATATATISYTGGTPPVSGSYSILPASDGSGIVLSIITNGVERVNEVIGVATGINGGLTLEQLDGSITVDSITAGYQLRLNTPPNSGQVNGAQVLAGTLANPLVVDAGHTFTAGTWVEITTSINTCGVYRYLTAVTATTIAWSKGAGITIADNTKIGHWQFSAGSWPITVSTSISLTNPLISINYSYWQPVSCPSQNNGAIFDSFYLAKTGGSITYPLSGAGLTTPKEVPNASFVNAENCCFIAVGGLQQICKYDGNAVYKAGLPSPDGGYGKNVAPGITTTGVGLTGTYKYKISYKNKDNRKRITESVLSAAASITLVNQKAQLTLEPVNPGNADNIWYNDGCAKVNGAQVAVNTVVVASGHTLRVGDTAFFGLDVYGNDVERTITAVTATQITFSGAVITVANNDIISAGMRICIYRTLNAGTNEYFLVTERPHNSIDNSSTYDDSAADSALRAQYIDPEPITKQPHIPPYAKYITMHGRLMVATEGLSPATFGGFKYLPEQTQFVNTLAWSDLVLGLEAWPLVNQERISSNSKSAITGIASDVDDILLIFKEDAIHTLVGELDANLYSVTEIARGAYGVSSHNSIEKVSVVSPSGEVLKFTIGLGRHGVVTVYGGRIIKELTQEVKGKFYKIINSGQSSSYLYRLSEAAFNPDTYQYLVSLPKIGTSNALADSGTDALVFDAEEGYWTRANYDDDFVLFGSVGLNYLGGAAVYSNLFHFVSHYYGSVDGSHASFLFAKYDPSLGTNAYNANGKKYTQDFIPQWDFAEEPSQKKNWQQLVVYSFQDETEFIPFDLRVRTYRNWEDPFTAAPQTDYTLNFTTYDQVEQLFDLVQGDTAKAMLFRFTVSTISQCMNLTGYEYVLNMPISKDQVKK